MKHSEFFLHKDLTEADPGGGGFWGSGPPNFTKRGKNVRRMREKTPRFST